MIQNVWFHNNERKEFWTLRVSKVIYKKYDPIHRRWEVMPLSRCIMNSLCRYFRSVTLTAAYDGG